MKKVDPDTLMPVWDAKGHIAVKRGNTMVAMPTGPEQLRMRLTVMAKALITMKMKHTGRNELKDITPAFFEKYKDYTSLATMSTGYVLATTGPWSLATSTLSESPATRQWRSRARLSS